MIRLVDVRTIILFEPRAREEALLVGRDARLALDAVFLEQMGDSGEMPARMPELQGEPEPGKPQQPMKKIAQRPFIVLEHKIRGQLNQHTPQLGLQRRNAGQKPLRERLHLAQLMVVSDLARHFHRENEIAGSDLPPVPGRVRAQRPVERGIHLHTSKETRIEL